ncbi:gp524 [Bacillus phage G]|uniref:Gp524 n=1 Tax=Bacillus phage G TaxID=2884420 RepID=G3MAR5_9CAUD|nr:gp524 [Bacillus phage G]AEO93782.1 gp524 [Bacillus phage G]
MAAITRRRWEKEEDESLVNLVLEKTKKGETLDYIFGLASAKLNRTILACSNRWYDHFHDTYQAELAIVKQGNPTTNDYSGPWTAHDEERLLENMVSFLIQDLGVIDSLKRSAQILKRSLQSCSNRWYNNVLKKNKLTVENMVAQGKKAAAMIKEESEVQEKVQDPQQKENRTFKNQRGLLTQKQLDGWSPEKRFEFYKMMRLAEICGHNLDDILALAAVTYNKSKSECEMTWENYFKDDEILKAMFEKEQNEKAENEVREEQSTMELEDVIPEDYTIKVEEDSTQKEVITEAVMNPEEILGLVKSLIARNKELEAEVKELRGIRVKKEEYEAILVKIQSLVK